MKDPGSSKGKDTGGTGKGKSGKGQRHGQPQRQRLSTVGDAANLVTTDETAEASQVLVKVRLVEKAGPGTRNNRMNRNLKLEARL